MKIEKFKQIKSTHTYLKENNNKYTENIAIIAEEQTEGIGTKGRKWHTGSNKNIAISILNKTKRHNKIRRINNRNSKKNPKNNARKL